MQKSSKIFQEKVSKLAAIVFVSLALLIFGCKENSEVLKDTYVSDITHDRITMKDGGEIAIQNDDRIYFLLRHAEKDTIPERDPDLTDAGYDRSYALADIFRKARIDEIYSTVYMRTLMTVDSISRAKGLSMKSYDPQSLKEFAENLKQNKSAKRFLIVGHSNTTPTLANHLIDKTELSDFDEKDYDNLLVVIQRDTTDLQLHKLQFKSN